MLKSTVYREIKMATPYGEVEIDKEGLVKGLKEDEEKVLGKLPGFVFEEAKSVKKEEPKKEEPKKEEPKKQEYKEEKPAPKRTTRRTTTNSK